jgi:hypothetical protein
MAVVLNQFILSFTLAIKHSHLILNVLEDTLGFTHSHLIVFHSLLLEINLFEPSLKQLDL